MTTTYIIVIVIVLLGGKKILLIEDIFSTCKRGVVYGTAGQEVEVIGMMGHVLLVKDLKGKTFPVQSIKTDYNLK